MILRYYKQRNAPFLDGIQSSLELFRVPTGRNARRDNVWMSGGILTPRDTTPMFNHYCVVPYAMIAAASYQP